MEFEHNPKKTSIAKQTLFQKLIRSWWIWLLVAGLIGIGAYAYITKSAEAPSGSAKKGSTPAQRSVPVVTAVAKKGDINIYLTGLGSVTPLNTVTVKSRVDGQLMKVQFQEGQLVKSGDLLAEIDPRPFEAQLTQAAGQMVRDQALLKNAILDRERYKELVAKDYIPKQQYDAQQSLVHQYEGAIQVDQGQIDTAKLQLIYCRITSPISGRVGLRMVDPGNIIHATDPNGLLVITQLQPIAVVFSIPEDSLPSVLTKLRSGERLKVAAFNREQDKMLATGYLLTVDNQIDPTTGTVKLKALFPNKDNSLFPSQFVNARLLLDVKRGTTVVPVAAVQRGSQGTFVYVVKADQTVEVRQVKIGPAEADSVSIDSGVSPDELVVVEGADRLREGIKVDLPGQGTPANTTKS
jgi:membrane fusion protein, multidrug efflux system